MNESFLPRIKSTKKQNKTKQKSTILSTAWAANVGVNFHFLWLLYEIQYHLMGFGQRILVRFRLNSRILGRLELRSIQALLYH